MTLRNSISSGYMGPGKARIQLQLCLATGMGWTGCRDVFERGLRAALYKDTLSVQSAHIMSDIVQDGVQAVYHTHMEDRPFQFLGDQ